MNELLSFDFRQFRTDNGQFSVIGCSESDKNKINCLNGKHVIIKIYEIDDLNEVE